MWLYRLGLAKAKEYALTGRPLSGREAAYIELINAAVPFERLEETVAERARELASIPSSQLAAMNWSSIMPTRTWGFTRPRRSGRSWTA